MRLGGLKETIYLTRLSAWWFTLLRKKECEMHKISYQAYPRPHACIVSALDAWSVTPLPPSSLSD